MFYRAYRHNGSSIRFKGITAGTKTFISSNGITLNDFGFTIGADTDVNVSGEAIHYIAI
jgi:hypothetical protein